MKFPFEAASAMICSSALYSINVFCNELISICYCSIIENRFSLDDSVASDSPNPFYSYFCKFLVYRIAASFDILIYSSSISRHFSILNAIDKSSVLISEFDFLKWSLFPKYISFNFWTVLLISRLDCVKPSLSLI